MQPLFSKERTQLWPPPGVPRSSEATTNPDLFYVVGKDDYVVRQDIEIELYEADEARKQTWWFGLLYGLAFLAVPFQEAWDRLRGHTGRRKR